MCKWRSPWHLLLQKRSFSSRSLDEKLRAVPFTRSAEEAMTAYHQHHRSLFSYLPSRTPLLRENFLPFWAVFSTVHVQISSAELGFSEYAPVFNYHTKRYEYRYTTVYKPYSWPSHAAPRWTTSFNPASQVSMQIYASFEYPRTYVNGIRSSNTFLGATRLTPKMVDDTHRLGRMRGLEEFRMRPREALTMAKDAIETDAREQATLILKKQYNADAVQSLSMKVEFVFVSMSPIYVPVFIFESHYLRQTVRTFIHGSTLVSGGQRLFNAPLAAIGGAGIAVFAAAMLGEGALPPADVIFSRLLLPAAVFGFMLTFMYPMAALKIRNWFRVREERAHFRRMWDGAVWDEEFVRPFDTWKVGAGQDQAHQEKVREEGRGRPGWSGFGQQTSVSQDPKGLYAALGLPPGASESEIKSAFRSLALKHHPDRYLEETEKQQAKARFQKISAAYQVLRDAKKRNFYNETGQV